MRPQFPTAGSERRGGVLKGFPVRVDTVLNGTTRLCVQSHDDFQGHVCETGQEEAEYSVQLSTFPRCQKLCRFNRLSSMTSGQRVYTGHSAFGSCNFLPIFGKVCLFWYRFVPEVNRLF